MNGKMTKNTLLTAFLLITCNLAWSQPPLVFAFQDSDNYPYQVGEGAQIDAKFPGVAVEMVQAIAESLGIELSLIRLPWKRGLIMLQQGEIDGLFNASFQEKRQLHGVYPTLNDQIDPSRRSYSNAYSLFKHINSPLSWDGEKFTPSEYRIIAPLGFSIVDDLRKKGVAVRETTAVLSDLRAISRGRKIGLVLLELSGDAYLNNHLNLLANISKNKPPLASKDYYLMLSHQLVKRNPELAEAIWNRVREFRLSGQFGKLFSKYID